MTSQTGLRRRLTFILNLEIKCSSQAIELAFNFDEHLFYTESLYEQLYTLTSKNVVGQNGEWRLQNERNCGFHIWYPKTISSSRGAKLILGSLSNHGDDGKKNVINLNI